MRLAHLVCCAAVALGGCQTDAGKQPAGTATAAPPSATAPAGAPIGTAAVDAGPSATAAADAAPSSTAATAAAPSATAAGAADPARAGSPPKAPPSKRTDGKADLPGNAIGKPQAPVDIAAVMSATSAQVTLTFRQAGHGVDIQANGVDGLSVKRDAMLASGRDVSAGEVVTFDVPILPGAGRSLLAVHVHGTFGTSDRAAVRAFPIGKRTAAQESKAHEGTTTVGGEPTHGMSAEEERK